MVIIPIVPRSLTLWSGFIPEPHRAIGRSCQQAALVAAQDVQHRAVPAPGPEGRGPLRGRRLTMVFPGEMQVSMAKMPILPSKS